MQIYDNTWRNSALHCDRIGILSMAYMGNERSVPRCDQFYLHLSIFISFVPILRLSECGLFWYFWFRAWFFHLKWSKNVQKMIFVSSKFCQLEIFPNQIFQNYDFGLLINIYLYKVKIYPPFVFDLVSEHDKSNLMFSQWSRCCPLMRWLPVIQIKPAETLTFAIFLPFEAMLCIQYKFSLIPKNAFVLQLMCYAEK